MATIKEIADYVGVSSGTVSRVLNHDSTISVSDETKMKIFDAAEELQYKTIKQRKNESKEKITKLRVGIIEMYNHQQQLQDPYYLFLRSVVDRECFDKGIEVVNIYKGDDGYKFIGDEELNGIISIGKFTKGEVNMMSKISDNIVFLDSSPNDHKFDSVKINYKLAINEALDYLVNLGHEEIGYIGSLKTLDDFKENNIDVRFKVYKEYMENKNIYDEENVLNTDEMTAMSGYESVKVFIKTSKKMPTAFFVSTDTIATGVLKALDENNIKVPDDISIIGFNDLIACQYTIPPLSTIRVHIDHLASVSVELIIENISKARGYCKKIVIPTELIIRKSTKEPKSNVK